MPTPPWTEIPAGFGQVTFDMACPGQSGNINIVIGFEDVLASGAVSCGTTIGGVFQDTFVEQMFAIPVTYLGLHIEMGVRPGGAIADIGPDAAKPLIGTQGANMLPVNNALLIRKLSGLGGRANKGRMFVPGVSEAIVGNDGIVDGTSLAQYQTDIITWFDAMTAADVPLVLLHTQAQTSAPGVLPKTYAANAPAPTDVITMQVSNKMATQRTRLRD